jgi:hypothetical protein
MFLRSILLLAVALALQGAPANANDACNNVAVLGVIPSPYLQNSAIVVVKNEGSFDSGMATAISVKISYLSSYGTEMSGPTLTVASLLPGATYRLTVYVPSYAASVAAEVVCGSY